MAVTISAVKPTVNRTFLFILFYLSVVFVSWFSAVPAADSPADDRGKSLVALLDEFSSFERRLVVVSAFHRTGGKFHFFSMDFLVGKQVEDVADAIEPRSFLIVRMQNVPRRPLCVGGLEHHVARARILEPLAARRKVHGAQLPLPQGIIYPRLETALLLFVADFE